MVSDDEVRARLERVFRKGEPTGKEPSPGMTLLFLEKMHEAGVLSDEQYAEACCRVLGKL